MRILVVGRGAREHALVWRLARTPGVTLFCAPGNAGTERLADTVRLRETDTAGLVSFTRDNRLDLVVIGPEAPLAAGLADALDEAKTPVFGPRRAAAEIESSKAFAKALMVRERVPTAQAERFRDMSAALAYLDRLAGEGSTTAVVKADGLAAGKGVIVCKDTAEALKAIDRVMVREEFGAKAGRKVVVEKKLDGEELSLLALVAGRTILPLPPTQDHKAVFDGDKGPNTGGMGAYCPAPAGTAELVAQAESTVFVPTVHAMKRGRFPFNGVLFAGLMLTNQGLRVLEFNCRFGDPETQPLLMRLKTDLLDLLEAVADERLGELPDGAVAWDPRPAVCVVLASAGYPGKNETGKVITGLDEAAKLPDVKVFHAGTRAADDRVLTDGGRVLGVTALGNDLAAAKARAYEAVRKISFPGMHYRTDIADKALKSKN